MWENFTKEIIAPSGEVMQIGPLVGYSLSNIVSVCMALYNMLREFELDLNHVLTVEFFFIQDFKKLTSRG
jgi:hypothetical protein